MIKTEFGTFDGNKWESISQLCFKNNFREESYQEIKATPGDYGIEGFTRTGKVFNVIVQMNIILLMTFMKIIEIK